MEHKLIRGVQAKCVVCSKATNLYDLDFDCPVHKKCQSKLIQDYLEAESKRAKVTEPNVLDGILRN